MTVTKVRRKLNRVLIFALAVMLGISSPLSAMAKEAVKTSNYVISKVDSARTELEKLAKSRSITGAIYLKDAYIVKSEADQYSEDVISIASGQSVSILSVDVDAGRNIWYKISYKYSGTTVKGYVEREFLVSSDSRFLEWEDKYITTTNREAIRDTSDCSDIEAFPENYRDALYALRKAHPNWRFVKQDVNLDWNTVINEEASGERSLISGSADSSYKEKESTGTSGWYVATKGIISYYMDPRNFLEEETIFMFEQETYNADVHTSNAVSKVLNGTFMSGGIPDTTASYADTFVKIGSKLNMSPIALASRVKQEQGIQGTSPLISGKYAGFEGYYNYFNVRANGATKELIYKNGLTYAKNAGWNTRTKSLEGGASIVANQYVNRGQDTLYLQKFDVDKSDGTLYSHQYMQNIVAPYSEAKSTYKAYSNIGLLDNTFVFKIPVYNNMPKGRCTKPNAKDVVSLNVSSIENLPVDQNAVLISLINGGQNNDVPMTYESSNKKVATVDDNGVVTGIAPGSVTISAKRAENTTNTASCKVNVIKADIAISKVEIPAISITYNPDVTLGSVELPDGFVWIDKTIIPTVENEGYSVTYSPDNSKYNALTLTIPVEVAKAAISEDSVKMPEDLTIDAGAELSAVTLPDGFVWKDNTVTAPKKTGTVSFDAIYCTDTANYETLTVQVNVKVVCKTHEYGAWEGTPADCENDGKQTRKCTICGAGESLEEKAFGHSYESAVTKEPTTKEPGERTYTCSKCHGSYAEEIEKLVDKHQHKYTEEITVKPGCLTTGTKTFTCSCGDSYTESIDAVGHTYNDKNECTVCDYVLPVVPVHIHSYTLSNDTATCTEDGEKVYSCGCGDSYTETSKKTGHSMKNGVCSICGYGKNEPTPTVAPTKTVEPTPTVAPTKKVEPTPTVAPTKKVEPTPTVAPTKKVEPTPTVAPTKKVEPTPTVAPTKKVEPTQAVEPTKKVEPTPTVAPTKKVEPTPKAKPTKKVEPTKGAEPTPTKAQASSGTDNNGSSSAQTSTDNASQTDNNQSTGTVDNKTETQPTGTTETKNDNQSTGTVENKTGNKSTASGETKKESQPADASETNDDQPISIVMMSTTILNKEKIEEYISTDNRCLEITMANDVVWNIDLTEVEDLSQIDMNLAVSFDDAQIPEETVADKAGENGYRLVDLKYDGEFEFPVTLKIPIEEKYVGKVANLFYYNPDTGELEYVAESLITDECLAIYRMKHASAYVMIYSDISMDPKIVAAIENIENAAEEEVETGGILAFADAVDVVGFADNKNIYYGGIAGIAVLVIGIVVGLIIYLRKDDLYYDDEDE